MVMSMDGIVAFDEKRDIRDFSSIEDHQFFTRKASACDGAVMGRYSYNPEIGAGKKYLLTHHPEKIRIDDSTLVLSGEVEDIIQMLQDDGNERVALLAGPRTNAAFLEGGYVDEIYLTVEPVLLGKGIHFFRG